MVSPTAASGSASAQVAGARHVDRGGAFVGVGVRQQPIERHVAEARIGAVALAIQEGALLRLDQHMDALHRIERGKVEALGDLQHLQHGEAGGVRRRLGDAEAAIGDARSGPAAAAGTPPGRVRRPARRPRACRRRDASPAGRDRSVSAPSCGDLLQRAREVGLADQRGERRHADIEPARNTARDRAIGGEHRAHVGGEVPVVVGDGEAIARMLDRRAAQLPPGQAAVRRVHRAEAGRAGQAWRR